MLIATNSRHGKPANRRSATQGRDRSRAQPFANVLERSSESDLTNLLETVETPLVILDANRRIRRFTPQAGALLNLTPAAVGKPIGDVALQLHAPDLELCVAQTMQTGAMVESEVQDRAERWHRMRIRPHRALDGRADGTILSLVDIHALKHDVADAQWERDYARYIVDAVQMPLVHASFARRGGRTAA